jgi:hypothetical protein
VTEGGLLPGIVSTHSPRSLVGLSLTNLRSYISAEFTHEPNWDYELEFSTLLRLFPAHLEASESLTNVNIYTNTDSY